MIIIIIIIIIIITVVIIIIIIIIISRLARLGGPSILVYICTSGLPSISIDNGVLLQWRLVAFAGVLDLLCGSVGLPYIGCLLYTSPSPRDLSTSRMPSSA